MAVLQLLKHLLTITPLIAPFFGQIIRAFLSVRIVVLPVIPLTMWAISWAMTSTKFFRSVIFDPR